jgi:Protein of unknown function (DUF4233)
VEAVSDDSVPEPAAAPRKLRRIRSVTESLLSIVLGLEASLVFFLVLVIYGLKLLDPALAFGGGAALFALLLIGGRVLRYPWGVWFAWVLQVLLLATGILVPLMFLVAAIFIAIFVYCFVRGGQLDRRNAAIREQLEKDDPDDVP